MKKLLTAFASLALTTSATVAVAACSDKSGYWNTFMSAVNNKETFVFMVSAQNCPHCDQTLKTTIKELYNNGTGSEKFKNYLQGAYGSQYNLNTYTYLTAEEKTSILNSKFYDTKDEKDFNSVWSEKWAVKLKDWIVTQERNAHLINGEVDKTITADSLGISGTPFFVYVKQGNYVGFRSGEIGNFQNGADPGTYMDEFMSHIVLGDWDIDHSAPGDSGSGDSGTGDEG